VCELIFRLKHVAYTLALEGCELPEAKLAGTAIAGSLGQVMTYGPASTVNRRSSPRIEDVPYVKLSASGPREHYKKSIIVRADSIVSY